MTKEFIQSIDQETFEVLFEKAKANNMSVQKLIRHIIIPEWLRKNVKK